MQKRAQKDGSVIKFDKPDDANARKAHRKMGESTTANLFRRINASQLIKLCGSDLNRLKNEVDKVCAYTEGEEIKTETIEKLVPKRLKARYSAFPIRCSPAGETPLFKRSISFSIKRKSPL